MAEAQKNVHLTAVGAVYPNGQQLLVCPICGWVAFLDIGILVDGKPLLIVIQHGPDQNVEHQGAVLVQSKSTLRLVSEEQDEPEEVEVAVFADYIRNDLDID